MPPDSTGLTRIARFSLSTAEWNVYSKSHPNHQVASSLMLHWWKRFVGEFRFSTGSQNSTKGQLPSTSQYHSFSVKPVNRKHSARANTQKAKEKAPSSWFGLLLGSLESETQNKKTQAEKPRQIKCGENVLTDLCEVKLPNFTEFHLQAEVVSPVDSIKDELETLPGSSYWLSLLLCFHSQVSYALSFLP